MLQPSKIASEFDQVSLTRTSGGKLQVEALVETDGRKQEILRALGPVINNPAVSVEVSTVDEAVKRQQKRPNSSEAIVREVEVRNSRIPADQQLRAYYSARLVGSEAIDEEIKRFTNRAMNRSRQALLQASELKRLAGRFSPDDIRALTPEARTKWLAMIREHAQACQRHIAALRQEIGSVFGIRSVSTEREAVSEANLARVADRLVQLSYANDEAVRSAFTISAESQALAYDGITGAVGPASGTVLSGVAKSVQVFAAAGPRFPVFTDFSVYAQDTWRISPRLSLTWGLRWEVDPPPTEANGNGPLTVQGIDKPATMTLAPRGTRLWRTNYGNFAPRLGLAYQLSSEPGRETVLRAGVGVFYDLGNGQAAQGFGNVAPFVAVKRLAEVTFPLSPEQAAPPPFSLSPPFGTIVAFDPNLQLPRTYQWNIAVEKSLGSTQTVSVAYVAALGRRLLREDALINPNPSFTVVRVTSNAAQSNYQSLQVQYGRRLAKGFQALASYAWSHSIDNASSDSLSRLRSLGTATAGLGAFANADRGPSDFDVRHAFTMAATYNVPAVQKGFLRHAVFRDWSLMQFCVRERQRQSTSWLSRK